MAIKGDRRAVSAIYMDAWNEIKAARKTEMITALVIRENRSKVKAIMSNVNDTQFNVLESIHECDVLCLTTFDYGVEYEIKVSRSDLMADGKKEHDHEHKLVKQTYFVVPSDLVEVAQRHLPEKFGIIEYVIGSRPRLYPIRKAARKNSVKWTLEQELSIYKKGYQRYLTIKEDLK